MKNSKIKNSIGFFVIALLMGSISFGQSLNNDALFIKMDTNNDGKLSRGEVSGSLAKRFSKIDTNNDGFITKTELRKAPKSKKRQQSKIN
jgi:Ca2+-binding EF-hand superfamily protein